MKIKKMIVIIATFFTLLTIHSVFSQQAKIDIEHFGYGGTARHVYFTIANIGEVPLSSIDLFIDGEKHETIGGITSPKTAFEEELYLDSGEHLIEVKTPEGAYDSLEIYIPFTIERTTTQPKKKLIPEENMPLIITITLIIILVIVLWFLTKRPKLKF